jgi:hypothetical protein
MEERKLEQVQGHSLLDLIRLDIFSDVCGHSPTFSLNYVGATVHMTLSWRLKIAFATLVTLFGLQCTSVYSLFRNAKRELCWLHRRWLMKMTRPGQYLLRASTN